jgi:hypothetical protein
VSQIESRDDLVVQSVTSVPMSKEDDIRERMRRYLITMVIRTTCFILAVVFEGWLRWTCVALAAVLPYVAVVFANARRPRTPTVLAPVSPTAREPRQLGS